MERTRYRVRCTHHILNIAQSRALLGMTSEEVSTLHYLNCDEVTDFYGFEGILGYFDSKAEAVAVMEGVSVYTHLWSSTQISCCVARIERLRETWGGEEVCSAGWYIDEIDIVEYKSAPLKGLKNGKKYRKELRNAVEYVLPSVATYGDWVEDFGEIRYYGDGEMETKKGAKPISGRRLHRIVHELSGNNRLVEHNGSTYCHDIDVIGVLMDGANVFSHRYFNKEKVYTLWMQTDEAGEITCGFVEK